jgi:hypothetical protein
MLRQAERTFRRFARRKALAILVAALAPLAIRAALLWRDPEPNPRIQDEFSHLLVADTIAHGHIVNPQHPLWAHFETMHVLVRPVYGSIYPAAHGALMGLGQALTGHPWTGVWLGVALMGASLCWMLQGWVTPGWALLGAVIAGVRFGVLSYWMNSYYGGAVAAAGGALALGALPRLWKRGRWQDGAALGAGLAILANSRPYEGAVFGALIMAAALWQWRRIPWRRVAPPLILIAGAGAAALGYYSFRFTGSPMRLPYSFYRASVAVAPHFVLQSPRPEPAYDHRVLHDFHTKWEMLSYRLARSNQPPYGIFDKATLYWRFFWGPALSLPLLLALPWMIRRRRIRWLLGAGVIVAAALAIEVWQAPHYAAPATGLVTLLAIEALRHLRRAAGPWAVRTIVAAALLTPVIGGNGRPVGNGAERAQILRDLTATGERHLVVVRYSRAHNPGDEWVYNAADPDHAPVVWAREMDPGSNRELVQYYAGRHAWIVEPDARPIHLVPYDPSMAPDPPFRFVALGSDAVTALRSPAEVGQRVRALASRDCAGDCRLTCDHWGFLFTAATGVEPPDPVAGCFPSGDRARPIAFDDWFAWLARQK